MTFLWRGWARLARRMAAYLNALSGGESSRPPVFPPMLEKQLKLKEFILDKVGEAIYLVDASLRFVYVNEEACRALGYPREELLRFAPSDIDPDTTPQAARRIQEQIATDGSFMFETRHRRRDGSLFPVEINSSNVEYEGQVLGIALVRDITERRQAQTDIDERLLLEEQLSRLTEMAPGALFTLRRSQDGQLSMPWVADKLVEIAGCWPEDAREDISALTTAIHAGDANAWRQAGAESARTLLPWHSEFRLAHPIRGETWIEWRATPARGPDGSVLWHGFLYDISERKQHEHQLTFMANYDTLTSLPNRILLTDRMLQAIAQSRRSGEILAVLFIDLDGFKPINDQYGHEAGDCTLIEIGQRMTRMLRASDTVARIGGDEFVVLLPGLASAEECEFSAQRLLKAIAEPVDVGEHRVMLSASIGIALHPADADDADNLLRCADEAMYIAKRSGRNQFVFFGNDARQVSQLDGGMVHDLRLALEQDQLDVHYQPIVDLATGRVYKAEALVRWKHPQRGQVSPVEFIPIAEEAGLIHAIGNRVFQKAVQTAREWNRACPGGALRSISVNRSPREFFAPDGADGWIARLNTQGVSADMLSLEITEGLLLTDRPKVLAQLKQLRAMGMTVALDDFGTGFSSLSYLKKFDIDYIKIDRSFVCDIVDDPADRAIVESIIAMARRLGIKLIAEGVETEAQAALLATADCDFAQGYLYARPMPEREFLDFACATETTPLPVPALLTHVDQK